MSARHLIPDGRPSLNIDDIQEVAVIGAGLMGHGIALELARGGYQVRLNDVSEEVLHRALQNIAASLETLQDLGLVDGEQAAAVPGRISTSTSLEESVSGAGFVVEAVPEDLALKRRMFAELDRLSPEGAILASNTSSFMASQLAPSTSRPEKVVVANWWNPPHLLPLVEVVRGPDTADSTIDTTCALL